MAETTHGPNLLGPHFLGLKAAKMLVPAHTGVFKLHLQARATLWSAGACDSVRLPPGINEEEWIAAQMLGMYEEVGYLVSLLDEFCTETECFRMAAGKYVQYSWA